MGCLDITLVGGGHSTTDNKVLNAEQIILVHYNVEHFSVDRNVDEDLFRPIHNSSR